MCNSRLDSRDRFPSGMEDYLATYGWHFSKALCEWASSRMVRRIAGTDKTERMALWDKTKVEELLMRYGIETTEFKGYDHVYAIHMARADYYGSCLFDEQHLAMFVKDYLCDPDGYEGKALTQFYADCIGRGEVIPWDDVI